MLYLGWIVAAFLCGFLAALIGRRTRPPLRESFARVDSYRGRSYREVLSIAGVKPSTVIRNADGTSQCTWQERDYSITLAFDARDMCTGVVDEQI